MNGREFGEALERELASRLRGWSAGEVEQCPDRYYAIQGVRDAIRAALASKDAGPQEKSAADCGHTEAWRSVCDELSIGNPLWLRGTGSAITLAKAELSRLRAWEKWGREGAKKALDYYAEWGQEKAAACHALAAMPQDPQGGVR